MQFLLLICLMAVCSQGPWPAPSWSEVRSVTYTAALSMVLVIAAAVIARRAIVKLRSDSTSRHTVIERYSSARTYFFFFNLGGFAVDLFVFGWGWAVQQIARIDFRGRSEFIPGGELLILVPFLFTQIASWCFFYDADRAFHRESVEEHRHARFWKRGGYVLFLFRQQFLIILAPLLLLITQQGLQRLFPEMFRSEWVPLIAFFTLPLVIVLFPLFLPLLLGLKPMPPGTIRSRLEASAKRLHFRYSRIYLWDTRGNVANAMIVGVIPWIRHVVFTDRLLEDLNDDEVDAVFGHEIGHARHWHMLYYGLFLILSLYLVGAVMQAFDFVDQSQLSKYRVAFQVGQVLIMGAYIFAAFGFVSRRCERQADVFGCRAVSCRDHDCRGHNADTAYPERGEGLCRTGIDSFIRALRRVEDINGMARDKPRWRGGGWRGKLHWVFRLLTGWLHTWQHSTIAKRVAFLERVSKDPEVERRFQTRVFAWKCVIALGLMVAIIGLGVWKGWEVLNIPM